MFETPFQDLLNVSGISLTNGGDPNKLEHSTVIFPVTKLLSMMVYTLIGSF